MVGIVTMVCHTRYGRLLGLITMVSHLAVTRLKAALVWIRLSMAWPRSVCSSGTVLIFHPHGRCSPRGHWPSSGNRMPSLLPTKTLRSAAGEPENTKDTERAFGGKSGGWVGGTCITTKLRERKKLVLDLPRPFWINYILGFIGRDLNRVWSMDPVLCQSLGHLAETYQYNVTLSLTLIHRFLSPMKKV